MEEEAAPPAEAEAEVDKNGEPPVPAEATSAEDVVESAKEAVGETALECDTQDLDADTKQGPEETTAKASEPKESSKSVKKAKQSQKTEKITKECLEPEKSSASVETPVAPAAHDSEEAAIEASESVNEHSSQASGRNPEEGSSETAMQVDDEEEIDVESVEEKSAEQEAAEAAARRVAAAQRVLDSVTEVTTPPTATAPVPTIPAPVPTATTASLTRIRPAPKPRGMAKSGRFWKSVRTPASRVVVRDSVSYEERMQKRQRQQVVKDLENQLKNERKQKLEELRKRREYNAKKATENALKSEVYQVVKNPNKIKRMKKKQLRLLQKRDTTVVGQSVLEK